MIFTHESKAADALTLPAGRYAANLGFLVEQSVNPEHVLEAATALLGSNQEFAVASQTGVIVKAQKMGVAFGEWLPLSTI